jgi:RHS repeat-associated protein
VKFRANGVVFFWDKTPPFAAAFTTQVAGTYKLTALAMADEGLTVSNAVDVTVTGGLTVSLTAPANNASGSAPATFSLAATTTDAYGTADTVKFFADGVQVGVADTAPPYTGSFTSSVVGNHVLTATATDSNGGTVTSAPITVTVNNVLPTVSLTSPAAAASSPAPATFYLSAAAADANGTIANVKFYADGVQVGTTDTTAPYSAVYANASPGTHTFTAKATDNDGGVKTSAPVTATITSGVSVTRTYVYDTNQRLCKTIDPEAGATVVDYDAASNISWTAPGTALTLATCDRGSVSATQKITRTYDQLNRLKTVVTPGNAADVTTNYEPDGKVASLVATNGTGGANPVTTTYAYNKRRLLTQETSGQAGYLYTLAYDYDANGNAASVTYPDLQKVTFSPDPLGRITQVASTDGTVYASGVTYFPNGAIKGFTYGNGFVHTMTQNARLLPARSRDVRGATVVLDDSYLFDANGNVTDITDQAQAGKTTRGMAYDALDRLTTAVSPNQWGNATYTYDALDNLRSADQGARQYRYNYDSKNRLTDIISPTGAPIWTFGYDANGNVKSKGSQAYQFDIANRLMSVTGLQDYRYDGQGRRVQVTDANAKKELWIYNQSGQLLYTLEERRSRNLGYIYLGNTQIATRAKAFTTGTVTLSYQHTDSLGSPVAESNASGVVTKRNSYAPYGEAYAPTVIDGTGYTGHVMDQATGLTYMQQRYYDPQISRFLSVDPMVVQASTAWNFNRYNYAGNNPYKFKDPDGRKLDYSTTSNEFKAAVAEIDATPEGHRMIESLDQSKNSFVLEERSGKTGTSPTNGADARNGVGTGGKTHLDPKYRDHYYHNKHQRTASLTARIAHELAHLVHFNAGVVPQPVTPDKLAEANAQEEINARTNENVVRGQLNLPSRDLQDPP